MTTMIKSINNIQDLLVMELGELYSIEQQIIEAMPQISQIASSPELKQDLQEHLETTKTQKQRLERIFGMMDLQPQVHEVKSFGQMLHEAQQMLGMIEDPDVRDAALISAAQKVEHIEMAGYGSARSHALEADLEEIAEILQQTLDEAGEADELLTDVAEGDVNVKASER